MGAALAALTIGAWFTYSALTGKSLADVFKGGLTPLDPSGKITPVEPTDATSDTTNRGNKLPSPFDVFGDLAGSGTVVIDGHAVAGWIAKQVLAARHHGWTGHVASGVRTYAEQVQACIHVCGNPNGCPGRCAKPGTSNHRGTRYPLGAVDVDDPAGFAAALQRAQAAGDITGPIIRNNLPNDRGHFSATGG
jgi:hypothetical protein